MDYIASKILSVIKYKAKTLHLLPTSFNVNSGVIDLFSSCKNAGGGGNLYKNRVVEVKFASYYIALCNT